MLERPATVWMVVWLAVLTTATPGRPAPQDEVNRLIIRAEDLDAQRKWSEAIAEGERALEVASSDASTEPARLAYLLDHLGVYYSRVANWVLAEDRYRRALATRQKLDPNSRDTAITLNNLAGVLKNRAHYQEAEKRYRESLSIRKQLNDQMSIAVVLNNLGLLYTIQGRFEEAEPLFNQSLGIRKRDKGPDSVETSTAENNLATFYLEAGKFALAEQAYRRAIAIREQRLGPYHPLLGASVGGLAVLYRIQGRYDEAEPLFKRSLAILVASLPPDHPDIGTACNNFGNLRVDQARYAEAEALFRCALKVRQKHNNTPGLATTAVNLARVLAAQQRYAEAETLLSHALMLVGKDFGPESLRASAIINSQGGVALEQSRLTEAQQFIEHALAIRERALGSDHPSLVESLGNLGVLHYLGGDWAKSVELFRRAIRISMSRSRRAGNPIAGDLRDNEQDNLRVRGRDFSLFVQAAYRLAAQPSADETGLKAESFEAAQWALESSAASSLAQASARLGQDDPVLAAKIRERQDLAREWQSKDAYLVQSVSQQPDRRDSLVEQEFRARMTVIETRISEIDLQLRREFPKYAALIRPRPLSVQEVQAELQDGEALVNVLTADSLQWAKGETIVWVVTRTGVQWARVEIDTAALGDIVLALRCGLDEREWEGIARPGRCRRLLGVTSKPRLEDPLPFNLRIAYKLYRDLLGPFEDQIKDKHLLIVASGPLTSLPFQVLVTQEPSVDLPKSFAGYKGAAWLGRRQPLTVLPSVASLQALRGAAKSSPGRMAYLGYGNPALLGDGSCRLHRTISESCAPIHVATADGEVRARAEPRSGNLDHLYRHGAGQDSILAEVRSLCPLPDTAYELRCVGKMLGVPESEIRLGPSATERDIKRLSVSGELANYRVVHFATHGLVAGDTGTIARRQGEPALVLTPPAVPQGPGDDGLLTASEVARLKLNADWVILSACNTASGDKPGAEALSGLARSFFYAGARTLLVSHWQVYSDAAVQLLDQTFAQLRAHPKIGRSEGVRRAMISLMEDPTEDDNSHPSVWAPFSVVGEGGKPI